MIFCSKIIRDNPVYGHNKAIIRFETTTNIKIFVCMEIRLVSKFLSKRRLIFLTIYKC